MAEKKGQISLLSFFSSGPPPKKQRSLSEDDNDGHENVLHSPSTSSQSTSVTVESLYEGKGVSNSGESKQCPLEVIPVVDDSQPSSSSSTDVLNTRDPSSYFQAEKKGQSSLLSFFSSGPPPKKQRSLSEDDNDGHENVLHSPSTSSQSTSVTVQSLYEGKGVTNSGESKQCPLEVIPAVDDTQYSSSSSTDVLNTRDPSHGPALALNHIEDGPFQPKHSSFPVTNGRKFRIEWYATFPWLEYSPLNDKAYCFTCRAFYRPETKAKADNAFILSGFSNWKKAYKIFENHQKSNFHMSNTVKYTSRIQSKKTGSVAEKVNIKYSKEVQENRLYLQALCESLIFCGKQAIALRGHDESGDSKNKGNFLELMALRSNDSAVIKQFFVERHRNFQYTSPTFQNELLLIISEQIKQNIASKIKEAKIFSIIADETQDIAKHEQVAVVLRYVNDDLEVHESFVGFYRTKTTDGETLASLLKDVLVSLDLDIKNLRGQCYDGASNMRGPYKGVAARLLKDCPTAMYIHSNAHVLNLCIVSSFTSVVSIRNAFFVLQSLYNFIEKSTKRHAVFENIQKNTRVFHRGSITLKSLCDTRWACRLEAVRALLDNSETTLLALEEISATDHDAGGQANALLKSMQDFEFLFDLLLLRRVLMQCDILSKTLQSSNVTYEVVKSVKESTLEVLQSFRSEDFFSKLFDHCTELANKCNFKAAELPRKQRVPVKLGGGDKAPFVTVEEYYKNTILFPVIDILMSEIDARLDENNLNVLNHLSGLLGGEEVNKDSVRAVCDFYGLNFDLICAELLCFYEVNDFKKKTIQERSLVFVEKKYKCAFPLIFELFRLFFTIPINSASCERSFSCLRRLKTYCRNTIGQERLCSLGLLAIERDAEIDITTVINDFDSRRNRRLNLA